MKIRYGPSGAHIFDRRSGLNVLMDEFEIPHEQWSVAPRYASIALTNSCELACSFCYAPKIASRIPFSSLKEWVHTLDTAGCLGVGFGGGEPTLYPKFASLCRELHEETDIAMTMTTHGHRFTRSLSDQLTGNVDFIRLSMDGVTETYERIRGRSFSAFKEKFELVRATARFGINYVVNDDTIDDLPEAADFVFSNGAEELLLLPEMGTDDLPRIRPANLDRLSKWVRNNYKRYRLTTSIHGGTIIDAPILPISDPDHGSYDFMHIDASGTLKLSAFHSWGVDINKSLSITDAIRNLRGLEQEKMKCKEVL